jgi:hypothetical protein
MKHSQTNEIVSWFKQAHASSDLVDGNIQEKVLHITAHLVAEE